MPIFILADATDPASWTGWIEKIGAAGFMGLIIVLGGGWCTYKISMKVIEYLFGPEGWIAKFKVSFDSFFAAIEKNSQDTANVAQKQMEYAKLVHGEGGPSNANDIRDAAHAGADALKVIGDGVGVDVSKHVEKIHEVLRSTAKV